jgi:hypothetical protein
LDTVDVFSGNQPCPVITNVTATTIDAIGAIAIAMIVLNHDASQMPTAQTH